MSDGQTLKEIRTSKNITQKELSQSIITTSALSKAENGNHVLNLTHTKNILQKLDMTFDEFFYINNHYQLTDRQQIVTSFCHLKVVTKEALLQLITQCQDYLANHEDQLIQDILVIAKSLMMINENDYKESISTATKKLIEPVWNRLFHMNTWYIIELHLVNMILFHFPLETSIHIGNRLERESIKYESFKNMEQLLLSVHMNIMTLYLLNHDFENCLQLAYTIETKAKQAKRLDVATLCQIRIGICSKNEKLINKGLYLLGAFNENNLLTSAKQEINTYMPLIP